MNPQSSVIVIAVLLGFWNFMYFTFEDQQLTRQKPDNSDSVYTDTHLHVHAFYNYMYRCQQDVYAPRKINVLSDDRFFLTHFFCDYNI